MDMHHRWASLGRSRWLVAALVAASLPVAGAGEELAEVRQQLQDVRAQMEAQQERTEALEAELQRRQDAPEVPAPDTGAGLGNSLVAGWDRGFYLQSTDGNYRLNIGGWIQPRYEYANQKGTQDTSSFELRRVRLDLRGHVIQPELTFRIMPELNRTANLRDAWINYAFDEALEVRFGQFTVPFQWHRAVGPRRQHFAERGVPSETFGFPNGRDVGLMAHGRLMGGQMAYGAGFFDGAGRNIGTSDSEGHMASARMSLAVLGDLPREESDLAGSEEPSLSVGGGLQGAWRNEARDWAQGQTGQNVNHRANYATATLDARFAWQGFSLAADGYFRHVNPQNSAVGNYDGWAYMATAGYFVIPSRLEAVARWSELQLDTSESDSRRHEYGMGINIYHRGHHWKTRVHYLLDNEKIQPRKHSLVVEHHLQF